MGIDGREREVFVTTVMATKLNETEGTDYKVVPVESDPPDTRLVSRSGKHATRDVEVVSIPCDATIRTDNHNRQKFEAIVRSTFQRIGFDGYRVNVYWTESAVAKGAKRALVEEFAKHIARLAPNEGYVCIGEELYEISPAMSDVAHYVSIFRLPYDGLEIHSSQSWYAPRDGRWIEAAVNKKLEKYGGNGSGLTLIVDGLSHLDNEQIQAFRTLYRGGIRSFDDMWIVSMGKAYRV